MGYNLIIFNILYKLHQITIYIYIFQIWSHVWWFSSTSSYQASLPSQAYAAALQLTPMVPPRRAESQVGAQVACVIGEHIGELQKIWENEWDYVFFFNVFFLGGGLVQTCSRWMVTIVAGTRFYLFIYPFDQACIWTAGANLLNWEKTVFVFAQIRILWKKHVYLFMKWYTIVGYHAIAVICSYLEMPYLPEAVETGEQTIFEKCVNPSPNLFIREIVVSRQSLELSILPLFETLRWIFKT